MKKVVILGATGSIGTQTLDILRQYPNKYQLVAFAFGKNTKLAKEIIAEFKPQMVASSFEEAIAPIKDIKTTTNLLELISLGDVVINALVGSVGLKPTMECLKQNKPLLLANKESLVMAGPLIKEYLDQGRIIVPIDSEHSALWDLIHTYGEQITDLYITASGGALRDYPLEELAGVKKEEALKHPNWKMGAKITVDSASMMNKVFEVWEAHYLFGYPKENIHALIDLKSHVHALVRLSDGRIYAHAAKTDMHLPIKYALEYPNTLSYNECKNSFESLEEAISYFGLKELDLNRYPLFNLTKADLASNPFYSVVANASNEALVKLFLQDKVTFGGLQDGILAMVAKYKIVEAPYDLEHILEINQFIQEEVLKQC